MREQDETDARKEPSEDVDDLIFRTESGWTTSDR